MSRPPEDEGNLFSVVSRYLPLEATATVLPEEEDRYSSNREPKFQSETNETKEKEGPKQYRGVKFNKISGQYAAKIGNPENKYSTVWLGTFDTAEAAAAAYDRAAFEMRGSKAILNFPLNVESGSYVDPCSQSSSSQTPSDIPTQKRKERKDKGVKRRIPRNMFG